MLIQTIKFELNNKEYEIENTQENNEKVFTNRHTRAIRFAKELDANRNWENIPVSFYEIPDSIDEIDEMVGTF